MDTNGSPVTPGAGATQLSALGMAPNRKYKRHEIEQMKKMLDLEVQHRIEQFEGHSEELLRQFDLNLEIEISKIEKPVRKLTMAEFTALGGNQRKATRTIRLRELEVKAQEQGIGTETELLMSVRKRKHLGDGDGDRAMKVARTDDSSPTKAHLNKPGPNKPTPKTPRVIRPAVTSNKLPGPSFGTPRAAGTTSILRSPSKLRMPMPPPVSGATARRPPSTAAFNPLLSSTSKVPPYPTFGDDTGPYRPYGPPVVGSHHQRGSIMVRPSSSFMPNASSPLKPVGGTRISVVPKTPAAPSRGGGVMSAMGRVEVPTKDGRFIELDPFDTSPGALDRLEISDSAKKHARDEMQRMHNALSKWSIRPKD
ncbi:hypothetical protein BKA62DRAFT_689072 [Auriculariales sp. MPI-PUGE-AT-0066]|nr:hypothetical protein BKA62DRAFT_689072 [Auriculariales sp. MPI-PUGE-AT-0066]